MLAKEALEIARDPGSSFYSRLFLVEKASGGWRPVVDLSHLNDFVQLTSFKMETVASVLLSVREGDFLAFLDLKDAYFQILIHRSLRKLLRFMSEGMVYQFRALCFGCVLSDPDPSIFEEAIEVHVGGDGLPVPSSVLRTVDRSPGLHQSLRGRVSVGTLPRDQTSPVSGRLVGPLLLGEGGQAGRPVSSLGLSHPRDCDKREEVGSRALADKRSILV